MLVCVCVCAWVRGCVGVRVCVCGWVSVFSLSLSSQVSLVCCNYVEEHKVQLVVFDEQTP